MVPKAPRWKHFHPGSKGGVPQAFETVANKRNCLFSNSSTTSSAVILSMSSVLHHVHNVYHHHHHHHHQLHFCIWNHLSRPASRYAILSKVQLGTPRPASGRPSDLQKSAIGVTWPAEVSRNRGDPNCTPPDYDIRTLF
jgi:hypothetical protein